MKGKEPSLAEKQDDIQKAQKRADDAVERFRTSGHLPDLLEEQRNPEFLKTTTLFDFLRVLDTENILDTDKGQEILNAIVWEYYPIEEAIKSGRPKRAISDLPEVLREHAKKLIEEEKKSTKKTMPTLLQLTSKIVFP